jgi:predicted anti-sigma-YlaC factor YlaD
MNCEEALRAFSEGLDGTAVTEESAMHLGACAACRAQAAAMEAAHRALLSEPELPWDGARTAAVLARVAAERRRDRLPALAAAAVLLLSAVLAGAVFGAGLTWPTPESAAGSLLSLAPDLAARAPAPPGVDTLLPFALAALGGIVLCEAVRAARPTRGRSRS